MHDRKRMEKQGRVKKISASVINLTVPLLYATFIYPLIAQIGQNLLIAESDIQELI